MTAHEPTSYDPVTRFDPGRPDAALAVVAPMGSGRMRTCPRCGGMTDKRASRGGSREHLVPSYLARCFLPSRGHFVVRAHVSCNNSAGGEMSRLVSHMELWALLSMHPAVRTKFPKRTPSQIAPPGPRIRRGQGAWR